MTDDFETSFAQLLRAFNEYADRRARRADLPELLASAEALYQARARARQARGRVGGITRQTRSHPRR